ncbi:MAG: orotidine-5'-phosphate decarboxylase [Alphaproteobacteria bacterium]|nr:orotidine-5'-phosphate decarboxylase [Alphaproteobacteria bacterium]
MTANPIYVALDTDSAERASALAQQLRAHVGGLKVGLEFVSANGPQGVRAIVASGVPVFLDVKLHDIPNTVAGAMKSLAPLGAAIVNVHASGGAAMMKAAVAAAACVTNRPKIIAVTVLTSLEAADLAAMGVAGSPLEQVVRLAKLAKESGIDGVVCSPQEIGAVRAACGRDFLIVTPGVRPAGGDLGDQKRVMTPSEALKAGADLLVIGRPITGAADPAEAARKIAAELGMN